MLSMPLLRQSGLTPRRGKGITHVKRPTLIVVHGPPASGKTHLSEWLSGELLIPLLSKDDIKESLFDHVVSKTSHQRRQIDAASFSVLWTLLDRLMATGTRSYIVETAFPEEESQPRLVHLLQRHTYQSVQVYCHAPEPILRQRYIDRARSGQRHPGHRDLQNVEGQPIPEESPFRPLDLPGALIDVDTRDLGAVNHRDILRAIEEHL